MRERASTPMGLLRQCRQWLKRNGNTRAATVAVMGGLFLGVLLRLCWDLMLLWLAPPANQIPLQAEAFAMGLGAMVLVPFTAIGFLHPRTDHEPSRAVIAGMVLSFALYFLVFTTIASLLWR